MTDHVLDEPCHPRQLLFLPVALSPLPALTLYSQRLSYKMLLWASTFLYFPVGFEGQACSLLSLHCRDGQNLCLGDF